MNDLDEKIDDIKDMLELAKHCETEEDVRLRLKTAKAFLDALIELT